MTEQPDAVAGPIAGALSLAGLLALLVTGIDWVSAIWPFNPGEMTWRYGAIGITAGFTVTAVIGIVLLAMGQLAAGRPGTLRVLGYAAMLIAVILGLGLATFILDGVQISGSTAPERRFATGVGVVIAALKLAGATLVFGGVGRGLIGTARPSQPSMKRPGPIVGAATPDR